MKQSFVKRATPFQITFSLRAASRGISYIMCRFYMDGQRCEPFSTGYKIPNASWDSKSQRPRADKEPDIAAGLEQLKAIYTEQFKKKKPSSPGAMRRIVMGLEDKRTEAPPMTLKKLVDSYLANRVRAHKQKKIKDTTIRTYKTYAKHLKKYLAELSIDAYTIDEFTMQVAEELEELVRPDFAMATGSKVLGWLREALTWAVASGYGVRNGMATMKLPKPHRKTKPLTQDQLQKLVDLPLTNATQIGVRQRFLLMCYTALNWQDVEKLPKLIPSYITAGGLKFCEVHRQKEQLIGEELPQLVWISDRVLDLVERQQGVFKISHQNGNDHLKVLGAAIGYENLTSKVARTTFTQHLMDKGVAKEIIEASAGWRNPKTMLKHYATVSPDRMAAELHRNGLVR